MSETTTFTMNDLPDDLESNGRALLRQVVGSYEVQSSEQNELAGALLKELNNEIKRRKEFFEEDIGRAHKLHRSLTAKRSEATKDLLEAKDTVKGAMEAYADRVAEAERKRIAEDAQRLKEREEKRRLEQAVALEEAGETEQAEAVLDTPAPMPLAPAPARKTSTGSTSTRMIWGAEPDDNALAMMFSEIEKVRGLPPGSMNNEAVINAYVGRCRAIGGAMRGAFNESYPNCGVRMAERASVAAR